MVSKRRGEASGEAGGFTAGGFPRRISFPGLESRRFKAEFPETLAGGVTSTRPARETPPWRGFVVSTPVKMFHGRK